MYRQIEINEVVFDDRKQIFTVYEIYYKRKNETFISDLKSCLMNLKFLPFNPVSYEIRIIVSLLLASDIFVLGSLRFPDIPAYSLTP